MCLWSFWTNYLQLKWRKKKLPLAPVLASNNYKYITTEKLSDIPTSIPCINKYLILLFWGVGVGFYCASFVEEDKSFSVLKFSCRRIGVIFPCLSDLVDNYYSFHPKLALSDNLILCFFTGGFWKECTNWIWFDNLHIAWIGSGKAHLCLATLLSLSQEPCSSTRS